MERITSFMEEAWTYPQKTCKILNSCDNIFSCHWFWPIDRFHSRHVEDQHRCDQRWLPSIKCHSEQVSEWAALRQSSGTSSPDNLTGFMMDSLSRQRRKRTGGIDDINDGCLFQSSSRVLCFVCLFVLFVGFSLCFCWTCWLFLLCQQRRKSHRLPRHPLMLHLKSAERKPNCKVSLAHTTDYWWEVQSPVFVF